jgi:hypothetical protein
MADITVRKLRFRFDEPIELDLPDEALATVLPALGLSLTMPYLEPYLIRSMQQALPRISDPVLAEDARRFSQQESHHYRNHIEFNDQIRRQFDDATASALRAIEAELEADYQRFSKQKPLRWNLAYAEGFEAMTCAGALAMAEHRTFESGVLPGGELWPWHMAEEIEHRTVAFEVFEHVVGSYLYRVCFGLRAQVHYIRYVGRFARRMAKSLGRSPGVPRAPVDRDMRRRYLRTFRPRYHPRDIELPDGVAALLARYSALAGTPSAPEPATHTAPGAH